MCKKEIPVPVVNAAIINVLEDVCVCMFACVRAVKFACLSMVILSAIYT